MLWQIGLGILGAGCFFYYTALCIQLKKWNSTFSVFWLLMGILCLVVQVFLHKNPDLFQLEFWKLFIIPGILFIWVEILIFSGMGSGSNKNLRYLIVLGAHVQGTVVTDSLARRLNCAATYLREHPDTTVVVSGGQGSGEEISEAQAMAAYLTAAGISSRRIVKENQSKTTRENLLFTKRLLEDYHAPVGIVTNNFHMYRACAYARKLGYDNVSKMPAGCHLLLLPNYAVREFFAILKFWIFF